MSYIVLSRKWRPQDFDQVIGQDHVTKVLSNALSSNKVSHSYLFSGPRGVGKTTIARILAKRLNNLDNIHTSLDIIELDGASNRGIDEIRDLKESIQYVPVEGKYKIFIIDEAHMLTKEAFNALLKTLEEPPAHAIFILATTENQKIPSTISSRCQQYEFKRISIEDIVGHLSSILYKEGYDKEEEALKAIALKADGSLRDALSLLDKVIALSDKSITYEVTANTLGLVDQQLYLDLIEKVNFEDIGGCLNSIDFIVESGISNSNFLEGFIRYVRNSICYLVLCRDEFNLSEQSMKFLDENKSSLAKFKDILNLSIQSLNAHNNLNRIEIENLFFKFFTIDSVIDSVNKKQREEVDPLKETDSKQDKKENSPESNKKLIDIYLENLKKIESENIRLYCVLEKVNVTQEDALTLKIDCLKLSKYENTLLLENIDNINKTLSHLNGEEIAIKLNKAESLSQSLEVDSEGNKGEEVDPLKKTDSKQDENQNNREPDKKGNSRETKEHPLVDLAINDYNGKIIK